MVNLSRGYGLLNKLLNHATINVKKLSFYTVVHSGHLFPKPSHNTTVLKCCVVKHCSQHKTLILLCCDKFYHNTTEV